MTPELALQIFGWLGSALLVFSVLQAKFLRFRVLNGVASVVLVAYNAALGVWPAVAMNGVLVIIDAYYIWKLTTDKREEKAFTFSPATSDPAAAAWFMARHGADVAVFHPELERQLSTGGARTSIVYHNDTAVGLVAFAGMSDVELLADYVIPSYRDYAPGTFVYSPAGPLAAAGVSKVHVDKPLPAVAGYLRQVGFSGSDVMTLSLLPKVVDDGRGA